MKTPFSESIGNLCGARAQLAAGVLSPVQHGHVRENALMNALLLMAEEHGISLRDPLKIDSLGEVAIAAKSAGEGEYARGDVPCGQFGARFVTALNQHNPRTGLMAGTLSAESGWCRMHHLDVEKVVVEYHDDQVAKRDWIEQEAKAAPAIVATKHHRFVYGEGWETEELSHPWSRCAVSVVDDDLERLTANSGSVVQKFTYRDDDGKAIFVLDGRGKQMFVLERRGKGMFGVADYWHFAEDFSASQAVVFLGQVDVEQRAKLDETYRLSRARQAVAEAGASQQNAHCQAGPGEPSEDGQRPVDVPRG